MRDDSMTSRFLDTFQGDVRNNISTFCRALWESDCEVFIFMARKAACFFDCLRELGVVNVRGQALSDRVLDMDLSFVRDKSVLLVDDCIFTGTTLYAARNAVEEAGCKSFSTLALAVNMDAIRHELLPGGSEWEELRISEPVFRMPNSDCVRQCYDIVRAVSILPRPYDVDFPHSRTVKVTEKTFNDLLTIPGWQPMECTSDYQKKHDVRTFTLLPHKHTIADFWHAHGVETPAGHYAKIRVYARRLPESGSYLVRFVPIVMLPAIMNDHVSMSLGTFFETEERLKEAGFVTPSARYRLLHYLTAHSLFVYFSEKSNGLFSGDTGKPRQDLAEMAFGSNFWGMYYKSVDHLPAFQIPKAADKSVQITYQCPQRPVTINTEVEVVVNTLTPFVNLYKESELKARSFIKKNGLAAAHRQEFPYLRRLLEGLTPGSLCKSIQSSQIDLQWAVSVLLDQFIDSGIAVPIIVEKSESCCKAFRHGEDAVLGEAEERLLIQALKAYCDATNVTLLRGMELQKLIVLVTQISVRNSLFSNVKVFTSISQSARIISIKGYLHGLVPILVSPTDASGNMGTPFVDGYENRPQWLVHNWLRKGYLREIDSKQGNHYEIIQMPELSIGSKGDAQARQVGRCLGRAVALKALNSDKDLVMLSTCTETDHMLRALSGEISIFLSRWNALRGNILKLVRKRRFIDAHIMLRSHDYVFTAINSGAMKYGWYSIPASPNCTQVEMLIQCVEEALQTAKEDAMADEWIQLWPSAYPLNPRSNSYVWKYIEECGHWMLRLNVAMRLIDHWILSQAFEAGDLSQKAFVDSGIDIEEWAQKLLSAFTNRSQPRFVDECQNIARGIRTANQDNIRRWSEMGANLISLFVREEAKPLLDRVTAVSNAYGDVTGEKMVPYAVFFDCPKHDDILHGFIEAGIAACGIKIEDFLHLPDNWNPYRTGRWVLISGGRKSGDASALCAHVTYAITKKGLTYHAAVVGYLAKNDCITRYSQSTERAHNFFFVRLSQLRSHIFPDAGLSSTLCFASECIHPVNEEFQKFSKVVEQNFKAEEYDVELGGNEAPQKTFRIAKIMFPMNSQHSGEENNAMKILICTATNKEDDALAAYARDAGISNTPITFKRGTYRDLGRIGNAHVIWARTGMGSGGSDGSLATVMDAIDNVSPTYVISCGLAFGADRTKQSIGDVLVSSWVRCYEKGRKGPNQFQPRGDRVTADPFLLQAVRSWRMNRQDITVTEGGLVSGEKLIDDPAFKAQILSLEPESIGGDMEADGIIAACCRRTVRWIVIKAICDWAEDKDSAAQPQAAAKAFDFVLSMIRASVVSMP
jgi:nucleoside phosphorylase